MQTLRVIILGILALGCLTSLMSSNAAAGPIFLTRGVLQHPLYSRSPTDTGSFLPHVGMWGGVMRGIGSEEDRFGWLLQIGAIIEIARWGEGNSLLAISGMELHADTRNEISFNPSGIIWEEYLLYVKRAKLLDWQLGFVQRCRHDIDNLDIKEGSGTAEQRTLIYSSLHGKAISPKMKVQPVEDIRTWLRGDVYLITQDYRLPESNEAIKPSFEDLAFSLGWSLYSTVASWHASDLYFRGDITMSSYSSKDGYFTRLLSPEYTSFDTRIELGLSLKGQAGSMQIFGGFESLQDDASRSRPRSNEFGFIGFKFTGADLAL